MSSKKNLSIKDTLSAAINNHQKSNFDSAKKLYKQIIEENPNHFEANFLFGTLFLQTKEFERSKNYLQIANKIKPDNIDVLNNLGIVSIKLKNFEDAKFFFTKATKIQPNYAYAHNNLGNTLKELGELNEAIIHYKKAIQIKHDYIDAHKNLMQIYEKSNQLIELKKAVLNAKNLINHDSFVNLYEGILYYRNNEFKEAKKTLESLSFKKKKSDENKEIIRLLTLGKCCDRIGNYNLAFDYFIKANKIFENEIQVKNFDKNRFLNQIKERKKFYTLFKEKFSNTTKHSTNESAPIFIIGFPRSGTTLLDVVLDSHPKIEVLEEKNLVPQLINLINNPPYQGIKNLFSMKEDQIVKLKNFYFNSLESMIEKKNDHKMYIDKLPLNIIYVGEISRIFPNAKFILSLRHPCDCVLSCFMQNFRLNDAMSNFLNLKDAANLYDVVMKLWEQYVSIFQINYHVVKYESLINNFETTIKSLLNFLNLPWDNSINEYLRSAKKRDMIRTPSYNQVIKPIYSHAAGRWKNYEKQISDIYPILKIWISKFNY